MEKAVAGRKPRIAVVYGGRNTEHEVSLDSARSVLENIDRTLFEVLPIKITPTGVWSWGDESLLKLEYQRSSALPIANTVFSKTSAPYLIKHESQLPELALNAESIDIIFPVLHGAFGEDGTLQGLLEMVGIPYVGANVLSSAICMDKEVAKRLVAAAGLPVVPYLTIYRYDWPARKEQLIAAIDEKISYPLFVKPVNSGSSVGISKVSNPAQLDKALEHAFQYDVKILIEKAINAREIEFAALENLQYGEQPLVSLAAEVIATREFFDYESKYSDTGGAQFFIPTKLSTEELSQGQAYSRLIFKTLCCEGMGRIDFLLDKENGTWYFNEVNTIPGFTLMSKYPKLWAVSGLSYQALITHLLQLAIARHQRLAKLQRTFQE